MIVAHVTATPIKSSFAPKTTTASTYAQSTCWKKNELLQAINADLLAALEDARPVVNNAVNDPSASPWQVETRLTILRAVDAAIANARKE